MSTLLSKFASSNFILIVIVGNAYFSKSGPRTITGLEILAKIIPEDYVDTELPYNSSTIVTIN